MSQPKSPPTLTGFRDLGATLEFQYRSASDPTKTWTTMVNPALGTTSCNCVGCATHGHCYHEADALGRAEAHRLSSTPAPITAPLPVPARRAGGGAVQRRERMMMIPSADDLHDMIKLSSAVAGAAGFAFPDYYSDSRRVFAAVLWAWERDVPVMTTLNHTFAVNGKIEADAQLMAAMIARARPGVEWRWLVEPSEADGAEVELWIGGMRKATGKWTPADALRAKQLDMPRRKAIESWEDGPGGKRRPKFKTDAEGKPVYEDVPGNWQLWPTRMYAWAAIKIAARLGAPDLINGLEGLSMSQLGEIPEQASPFADVPIRDQFGENPWHAGTPAPAEAAPETREAPQESAPPSVATPTGYPWLPPLQALRAHNFEAVADRAIGVIVKAEGADMMEAIDRWCFAEGPAADLHGRMRELLKLATRWQLDQAEQEGRQTAEQPQRTPMFGEPAPTGARSVSLSEARRSWTNDDEEDFGGD